MHHRSRHRTVFAGAVIAVALALGACSSSSHASESATTHAPAAHAPTTHPGPTTNIGPVPSPFLIHQRFGTGDRWEITTVAAKRDGRTFTITFDVLNDGPGAATFGTTTAGLFTLLDEYPSPAVPSPPQHASAPIALRNVPAHGTRRIVATFTGLPPSEKHPVVWFHGHLLPGTTDATVWFTGI